MLKYVAVIGACLVLAACGTDQPQRTIGGALGGGAIGAGGGALLGGLATGPFFPVGAAAGAVTGAILGGGAGGAVGALTPPSTVNVGPVPGYH